MRSAIVRAAGMRVCARCGYAAQLVREEQVALVEPDAPLHALHELAHRAFFCSTRPRVNMPSMRMRVVRMVRAGRGQHGRRCDIVHTATRTSAAAQS